MPNNQKIPDHPLLGTTHTFRPDLPPYDGDKDTEPGPLIVGNGMPVVIKAVFQNWNGVPGLDMLYVFCTATGFHTHITPADLGMPSLAQQETDRGIVADLARQSAFYDEHPRVDAGPDKELTDDEFEAQFESIDGEDGSFIVGWGEMKTLSFAQIGRPVEGATEEDHDDAAAYVWTAVDSDDDGTHLIAGVHRVNAFGWVVTKNPWQTGEEEVAL